jgi:hypothetical protein
MRTPTLTALLLLAIAAQAHADVTPPGDGALSVKQLWNTIPQMSNTCEGQDKGVPWFDYGFPGGGMRTYYCYFRSQLTYAQLVKWSGVPMFQSGPHSDAAVDLHSPTRFGHYNPAFVRWLGQALVPHTDDKAFLAATQALYQKYLQPLARIYYVTYLKLQSNRNYLEGEKRSLIAMMGSGAKRKKSVTEGWYEKYALFMNPEFYAHAHDRNDSYLMDHGFDGGWDCNLVKTAVGFWIRRSLDGSDGEFIADLRALLAVYDPGFLANPVK